MRFRSSSRCSRKLILEWSFCSSSTGMSDANDVECVSGAIRVTVGGRRIRRALEMAAGDGLWRRRRLEPRRIGWRDRGGLAGLALLVEPDLVVQGLLQLVGGALELVETTPERPPQFGELAGTEHDERHDEYDHELRETDGAKHDALLTQSGSGARLASV